MSVPIYRKIKNALIEKISTLSPNDPVESERILAFEYKASRMTVRKAIDELVDEGYLYRDANRGTFVSDAVLHKKNTTIKNEQELGNVDYKIIYFDVKATSPEDVQEYLYLRAEDAIVRMVRLLLVDAKPLAIEEIYIKRLNLSDEELGNMPKWRDFNAFIAQGSITQRFVPTLVPMRYAHFLGMKINEPIILIENFINSKNGQPLIYMRTYNNPKERVIEITS
ncbi:MAG: GntR family transcriptional regulator [Breznakia sp.]